MGGGADPWTRYWATGRLDACAADDGGRYFPEIRDRWWRFFADLDDGAAVLDVATGNGAVLAVAAEYAARNGVHFELVGVDKARPSPDEVRTLAERAGCSLELRGETPAEALPFEADRFAAVTAQFALEYTETPRALARVAEVLAPGGDFMMIGHRDDSAVAAQTRRDREDVRVVLRRGGLLDRFDALVAAEIDGETLAPERRATAAFRDAREAFRREAAGGVDRCEGRDATQRRFLDRLLTNLGELYQHRSRHPLATVRATQRALREEVSAHGARLDDLLAAALAAEDRDALRAGLEEHGFALLADAPVRRADGAVLGHELRARLG